MIDVVIVITVPDEMKLVPGSGALLSRDSMEVIDPAHTEVYRYEFEDKQAIEASLGWLGTQAVDGGKMWNHQ